MTLSHVRMGPKVFINCAGFIKIDTKELSERYRTITDHTQSFTGLSTAAAYCYFIILIGVIIGIIRVIVE